MSRLKHFNLFLFLSIIFLYGCATDAVFHDLSDNKYLSVDPFPNPDATYVGTWTASTAGTLLCIRINPDGTAKYCQNKWNGITEKGYAKIYKGIDGDLFLIFEGGIKEKIIDYSIRHINTMAYGIKYQFVSGVESANCEDFLKN